MDLFKLSIATPWQLNAAVILLVLLVALNIVQFFVPPPTPSLRYEYKIEIIPDADFTKVMNQRGAQHWEAVSARRTSDGDRDASVYDYEIIFRRVLAAPSRVRSTPARP